MSPNLKQPHSRVVAWLKETVGDRLGDFVLFDVGASRGIDPLWRQWEPLLKVEAFEPNMDEVHRRNDGQDPHIRYHGAWVGAGDGQPPSPNGLGSQIFGLSSCYRATELLNYNYAEQIYNKGNEITYADARLSIDEFCETNNFGVVDFIKIDTDGSDFAVLRGAVETLLKRGVLGVLVEFTLNGCPSPDVSTFSNIDRLLQGNKLQLFDVDMMRYSRRALPDVFEFDDYSSTRRGPVQWGDGLYFVDPVVQPDVLNYLDPVVRDRSLLKLVALYDIHGLPDCAAELITWMDKQSLRPLGVDTTVLLDLLVPENPFGAGSYADYISGFDQDPQSFFPSKIKARGVAAERWERSPLSLTGFGPLAGISLGLDAERVSIQIPAQPWHYAAAIQLSETPGAAAAIDIEVLSGSVALACADSAFQSLGEHTVVDSTQGRQELVLQDTSRNWLLIRNAGEAAASKCLVHSVHRLEPMI